MSFKSKVSKSTRRFLRSKKLRTTTDDFILEFKRDDDWLEITTWGHDYQGLSIPETYQDLIRLKTKAQLNMLDCDRNVAINYYMTIMREVNP